MYILGFESSCDETACAVVEARDGKMLVRSDVISSQVHIHSEFGGVVPELASRHHLTNVIPVLDHALTQAGVGLDDLGLLAATEGPGLIGALLVAVSTARSIAFATGIPFVGVHHLEGHLLSAFLTEGSSLEGRRSPQFPLIGLLVSGGHTALILMRDFGNYQILGTTRDDAAGEALDKVGKLMGLGYPAGPSIERLAEAGDPQAIRIPKAMLGRQKGFDFSFSGTKTHMSNVLSKLGSVHGQLLSDVCASFQEAIVEQLVRKALLALHRTGIRNLLLCGGVACNRRLRTALHVECERQGFSYCAAPARWCTDNAAMIACAGYHRVYTCQQGTRQRPFSFTHRLRS